MSIKTRFDRCCRKYKAGIQDECSEKNNSEFQNSDFSSKESFLANRRSCPSQKQKDRNKTENVYKRIPPHLTYIGDTIDQGVTRLGGL